MRKNKNQETAIYMALARFFNGDWGNLCPQDKDANDEDLKNNDGHVLGRYFSLFGDIYIHTELPGELDDGPHILVMYVDEY